MIWVSSFGKYLKPIILSNNTFECCFQMININMINIVCPLPQLERRIRNNKRKMAQDATALSRTPLIYQWNRCFTWVQKNQNIYCCKQFHTEEETWQVSIKGGCKRCMFSLHDKASNENMHFIQDVRISPFDFVCNKVSCPV